MGFTTKTSNPFNIKQEVSMPPMDYVSEEAVGFRLDHQELTMDYNFYFKSKFLGSQQSEVWPQENLLLVHRIDAFPLRKKTWYGDD